MCTERCTRRNTSICHTRLVRIDEIEGTLRRVDMALERSVDEAAALSRGSWHREVRALLEEAIGLTDSVRDDLRAPLPWSISEQM